MIIPNFIIPFGIKIPVHSVMHDLIFLDVKETVNGKIDYKIKKYLLKRAMKKSKSIACVSILQSRDANIILKNMRINVM